MILFLSVAKNEELHPDYYPIYLTALSLGMRRGEILGLRWKDVDLDSKIINVQQQLLKPGCNPIFGPT